MSSEQGPPQSRDGINQENIFICTSKKQSHLPGIFSFTAFWESQKYTNISISKRSVGLLVRRNMLKRGIMYVTLYEKAVPVIQVSPKFVYFP